MKEKKERILEGEIIEGEGTYFKIPRYETRSIVPERSAKFNLYHKFYKVNDYGGSGG